MPSFWQEYPEIEQKLNQVQDILRTRLKINAPDLQQALTKFASRGGKMVRPALFFLFTQIAQAENHSVTADENSVTTDKNSVTADRKSEEEKFVKIAASLEMLHAATLIHDDIIDDSPIRRGLPSIEAQFGKDVAVYTGDFVYTVYFELLIETMQTTPFLARNAKSMKKILQGELTQKRSTFDASISVRRYLKAIAGKTAELLALSCLEGAYFAGGSKLMQRKARKIGLAIGLAFQIYDDLLNFTIGSAGENKPILTDVRQGIFTLPLLFARDSRPTEILPYLENPENLSRSQCEALAALVESSGGMAAALAVAEGLTESALRQIATLPDCEAREVLEEATVLLLQRQY